MNKFRLTVRLLVGFLLLLMPLALFHGTPGHNPKLLALKCMVVSLIGLTLLVVTLWSIHFSRSAKQAKDDSS
jgi:hypothetical protein